MKKNIILKESDINEIYEKFVKCNHTDEYDNRYNPLPLEHNNKNWRWENKDFPRVIALLEFKRYMEKYNFFFDEVLSFNDFGDPEYEYLKYKNRTNIVYEQDPENNDLHTLNLNKKFDFAMLNQTIEHLYDPITALKNVYNHLNDGGIFYANVPANNLPHCDPFHYYTGITPVGLGAIAKAAGFEILEIGQWGNKEHLHKLFDIGWIDYTQMSSIKNDITCPIITWIIAKK
jgi:SAM-dependent methyltransferase